MPTIHHHSALFIALIVLIKGGLPVDSEPEKGSHFTLNIRASQA